MTAEKGRPDKVSRRKFLNYVVAGGVAVAGIAAGGYYATLPKITQPTTTEMKEFKVAFVYSTPLEEPWCTIHHNALLRAQRELGVQYAYTDNASAEAIERITREYAASGYNLVYTDAAVFDERARVMAKDYLNTLFMGWSILGPTPPNFGTWYEMQHESAFLCGMLAAGMSKTGVVGAVAGFAVPPENLILWGFLLGAKEVNSDAKFKLSFIESWFDPVRAKEAALAQTDTGVDVIYAERYGVIDAAVEKGILAIGHMIDQHELGPDTVITSAIVDPYPMHKYIIQSAKAGLWEPVFYGDWTAMSRGGGGIAPYFNFENKIPTELKAKVEAKKQDIMNGNFVVPVNTTIPPSD